MCAIDDAERCHVVEQWRKARKAHACDECGRAIESHESYVRVTLIGDDGVSTTKTCAHCHKGPVRALLHYCAGVVYFGVMDDIAEHALAGLPWSRDAARWLIAMRRKWRRFDGSGLMTIPVFRLVETRR